MNADKLSVKICDVEISLQIPGDVFLKVRRYGQKVTKTKLVMYLKKFMP